MVGEWLRRTELIRNILAAGVTLWWASVVVLAQGPSFDAVSVKTNRSGSPNSTIGVVPGGFYRAENTPLQRLIPEAFGVLPFQVVGGPGWLETERFDITARPPSDARAEHLPAMLQALLVERFGLKTHREQQDRPVYALTVASVDKLGPQLSKSSLDCDQQEAEKRLTPICSGQLRIGRGGGQVAIKGRSLARLAAILGSVVGRVVVDQSGLAGKYDLELMWSAGDAAATSNDPDIFSAVREQLGLQLKAATGMVELVVIDSVNRPTAD